MSASPTVQEARPLSVFSDRPRDIAEASGFDSNKSELANHAGTASAIAREEAELKAAIVLARQFPRDEAKALAKIMRSCERPSFAGDTMYRFPRGKGANASVVEGPSVYLAREIARVWGNLRCGVRIISVDDKYIHIKGYAWDAETGAYNEGEDKFERLIQRRVGRGPDAETKWIEPDERDLRELVNRRGAMLMRNAVLSVVPSDIIDMATERAKETIKKMAEGEIRGNAAEVANKLSAAFALHGVTAEDLASYLGHSIFQITKDEVVTLRGIYSSLRDGNSMPDEYFGKDAKRARPSDIAALRAQVRDLHDKLVKAGQGVAAASALATASLALPQIAECKDAAALERAVEALQKIELTAQSPAPVPSGDSGERKPVDGDKPSSGTTAVGGGQAQDALSDDNAVPAAQAKVMSLYGDVARVDAEAAVGVLEKFQMDASDVAGCANLDTLNAIIGKLGEAKLKLASDAAKARGTVSSTPKDAKPAESLLGENSRKPSRFRNG